MTDSTSAADVTRPALSRLSGQSPGFKFIVILFLTLLLLIPSLVVWLLVEEREGRAESVTREIANAWGKAQFINGPYLVVPFERTRKSKTVDGEVEERIVRNYAVFLPQQLNIGGDLAVEARKKGIFETPVYRSSLALEGKFAPVGINELPTGDRRVLRNEAFIVLGLGDVRAIKNEIALQVVKAGAEQKIAFEPGLNGMRAHPVSIGGKQRYYSRNDTSYTDGIHAPISAESLLTGVEFKINADLNGTSQIMFAPSGQTTNVALKSDWPHPGFIGAFLPEKRNITEQSFEASWRIPYLARGVAQSVTGDVLPLSDKAFGTTLVQPLDFYQAVARALKYAIGLIGLTFLALFILELKSGQSVHWVQYMLVGMALIVFYVLLLAIAEHAGFTSAYLLGAGATTVLIGLYVWSITKSMTGGVGVFATTSVVFGIFFLILREDEYALVVGAAIAFLTIAATMFATRNVNWSGKAQ